MRLCLLLAVLAACGAKRSDHASYGEESYRSGGAAPERASSRPSAPLAPSRSPSPPPPPPPPMVAPAPYGEMADAPMDDAWEEAPPAEPEDAAPDRMVHYNGHARIRTPRATELIAAAVARAEAAGGFVESRGLTRVTLRVPAASFAAVWADLLALGPVVSRRLSADDVTEAFSDLSLRLASLEAARARYVELLAKAADPEDKLRLLQEIHRLTEQIDVMRSMVDTLSDLAAMSRVTIEAEAPDLADGRAAALPVGMQWIDRLSAFDRAFVHEGRPVKLLDPDGFVRLDPKRWHAHSADGAVVWAGGWLNDPVGDERFWRGAIRDRIAEQLGGVEAADHEGWALLRFVEPGTDDPYIWHVGVRVSGRRVEVMQAYYPTAEQERRHHSAVLAALRGGDA